MVIDYKLNNISVFRSITYQLARFFGTKKGKIVACFLVILIMHGVAHSESGDSYAEDTSKWHELSKKYIKPILSDVSVLQYPTLSNLPQEKITTSLKLPIRFIFLVEKTENYRFRQKVTNQISFRGISDRQPLFIQLCSHIDVLNDENTIFVQTASFYNPWPSVVTYLWDEIGEFIEGSQFVIFVSSNTFINFAHFSKLEQYLLVSPLSYGGVANPNAEVIRDPASKFFVPSFLYKQKKFLPSPKEGLLIFASLLFHEGLKPEIDLHFPLPVFFGLNFPYAFSPLPSEIASSFDDTLTPDLCALNSSFAVVGFDSQKAADQVFEDSPDLGYTCLPVLNIQWNNLTILLSLLGLIYLVILSIIIAKAADFKRKDKFLKSV